MVSCLGDRRSASKERGGNRDSVTSPALSLLRVDLSPTGLLPPWCEHVHIVTAEGLVSTFNAPMLSVNVTRVLAELHHQTTTTAAAIVHRPEAKVELPSDVTSRKVPIR
jgi:hypothetical protein